MADKKTAIDMKIAFLNDESLQVELRAAAGQAGYTGGFIEHYMVRILYPPGLTPTLQIALGTLVVAANAVVYGIAFRRLRARNRHTQPGARPD